MQNSLTQPRPLTSDSIIQFSPSTFSPSRRGTGEWIADCSLKPFTFACGPWTTRKYQICSIYCLQNSLNGHSENVLHAACVRFRSIGTMMSSMMTKRSANYLIIDGRKNKITILDRCRFFFYGVANECCKRVSYAGKIMKRSRSDELHRTFTDDEIIGFIGTKLRMSEQLKELHLRHMERRKKFISQKPSSWNGCAGEIQ